MEAKIEPVQRASLVPPAMVGLLNKVINTAPPAMPDLAKRLLDSNG